MPTEYRKNYLETLGLADNRKARRRALNRAHEIRQFEIRMLWQRAVFIWGFQVVIFLALGSIATELMNDNTKAQALHFVKLYMTLLASLGFLTSLALIQINKGSKFWQETWEYHIDMLEEEFEGNIHKGHLKNKGHMPLSVSKINLHVSCVFFLFWIIVLVGLLLHFLSPATLRDLTSLPFNLLLPLVFLICGSILLCCHVTSTSEGEPNEIWLKQRTIMFKGEE